MPAKLTVNQKVAQVLNEAANGAQDGLQTIYEKTGVGTETISKILRDFPLWEYCRRPEKFNYSED